LVSAIGPNWRCSICKRPSKEKINAAKIAQTNDGLMACR
jgi:hypothetical protein